MEPGAHRSGGDHGRRAARGGRAGRLLRPVRPRARHGAEPPHATPVVGGHGAARQHGRRRHPRREGEGPQCGAAARPQGRRRPRAVPGGHDGGRAGAQLPGRAGRAGGFRHRDVRRDAPECGQLAVAGRALFPADGQAAAPQAHPDRRTLSERTGVALPGGRGTVCATGRRL